MSRLIDADALIKGFDLCIDTAEDTVSVLIATTSKRIVNKQPTIEPKKMKRMMAWEAKQKGYTCNDCFLSMQNCHDMSICCEDETGLCDWFEEIADMKEGEDG